MSAFWSSSFRASAAKRLDRDAVLPEPLTRFGDSSSGVPGDRDGEPVGREPARDRLPDAPGPARDQRHTPDRPIARILTEGAAALRTLRMSRLDDGREKRPGAGDSVGRPRA